MGADAAEGFSTLGVALVRTPSYFFWSGMELSTEASFVCESPQAWLPNGYSRIFRSYMCRPFGLLDYGSASLRCKI